MAEHNVINNSHHLPRAVYKEFPAMRWNPKTGESLVVNSEEEIPAGYLDHHPEHVFDGPAPERAKPAPNQALDREEVKKLLSDADISFAPNAGTAKLNDLLITNIREALTEANIDFDADSTDAKALIALFPTKE